MEEADRKDVLHRINDSVLKQLAVPEWIEKVKKYNETFFPVLKNDENLINPEKSNSSGYD